MEYEQIRFGVEDGVATITLQPARAAERLHGADGRSSGATRWRAATRTTRCARSS